MTGPEPGDLAEIVEESLFHLDGLFDDRTSALVICDNIAAAGLSVVPTDSLEAALESDETLAAAAYAWLLAEEASPALLGTEEIVRVVVGAVAAAVRSAITTKQED